MPFLIRLFAIAFVAASAAAAGAQSQTLATKSNYPARPIRLIVPVAPGGGTEVVARIIAIKLSEALGQQVVVDNRAGGGGVIGTEIVARASPDGYTLLFALASYTVTPFLVKNIPYDPVKSFTPITQVATQALVLAIHPSLPVNSVKELIAYAKTHPGKLNVGIASMGGAGHVAAEYFKQETKTQTASVMYKGGAPMLIALAGGEVQLTFATSITAMAFIKQNRVKVLATSSKQRLPYFPEVPTLEEAGLKGFEVAPWQGLLGPAGLSRAIVDQLYTEVGKLLRLPEVRERLAATGSDPVGSTPEEFAAQIKRELKQFGSVIKAAGIKAE
ncbi:MAG: tripartite tricarboxylate transporter substrate binding protein [Betaproteobacteria bacterium]|nr:tripartite tricarboxylate transporter substrate binding protein [Betaproteobacteria bacterium]MBI2291328.1 tripartite tricarboxylate transporter substrate binding protein [Betaproteobacteria bacterium]MBI3055623.1 tripartite tricarboxylate transporter substrate binding protein [Betaproteobacteria bacterium]